VADSVEFHPGRLETCLPPCELGFDSAPAFTNLHPRRDRSLESSGNERVIL